MVHKVKMRKILERKTMSHVRFTYVILSMCQFLSVLGPILDFTLRRAPVIRRNPFFPLCHAPRALWGGPSLCFSSPSTLSTSIRLVHWQKKRGRIQSILITTAFSGKEKKVETRCPIVSPLSTVELGRGSRVWFLLFNICDPSWAVIPILSTSIYWGNYTKHRNFKNTLRLLLFIFHVFVFLKLYLSTSQVEQCQKSSGHKRPKPIWSKGLSKFMVNCHWPAWGAVLNNLCSDLHLGPKWSRSAVSNAQDHQELPQQYPFLGQHKRGLQIALLLFCPEKIWAASPFQSRKNTFCLHRAHC